MLVKIANSKSFQWIDFYFSFQTIIVWDWEKRRKRQQFNSKHQANVFQSKFLPLSGGSRHIVSTSRDGQVRLAILRQDGGDVISKKLTQHRGSSNKLALLGGQVVLHSTSSS